jgi:uncharacterized membrane protein
MPPPGPYPFIPVSLVFSDRAAHAAALILVSQSRQARTKRICRQPRGNAACSARKRVQRAG